MSGAPERQSLPASVWSTTDLPAPPTSDVLTQIADFLKNLGYAKTVKALTKEAESNGTPLDFERWPGDVEGPISQPLGDVFIDAFLQEAENADSSDDDAEDEDEDDEEEQVAGAGLVDVEAESTSDDSSDEESEAEVEKKSAGQQGAKRKRELTPPSEDENESASSDSEDSSSSDSDSDSSDEESRPSKRTKVGATKDDSSSSSSSESDSSDADSDSSSEIGDADSASDSSSSSESDSSDTSSDESDAEEAPLKTEPPVKAPKKKQHPKVDATRAQEAVETESPASSATLSGSPQPDDNSSMHPSRQARLGGNSNFNSKVKTEQGIKKANVPFSRIAADTVVDPRFSSNDYVSYDYADKAYQDLSVTKGKGFTKEKNKKKRGSYRGGAIDFTPKGIKFED